MNLTYIFSSFIFTEQLTDISNKSLVEYAHTYQRDYPGVVKSNYGGWQSDIVTVPNDDIGKLVAAIISRVELFRTDLGIKSDANVYVSNIWININPPGTFNRPHIHPDCVFAGVYYVAVPENSGGLTFKHPAVAQQYHVFSEVIEEYNSYSASSWAVDPKPGNLVIFPAWLEHYVEPNLGNSERISIAFNINIGLN